MTSSDVRNQMRSVIFQTRKPKTRIIDFFGVDIELRQPLLGDIIEAKEAENREAAVIETLVSRAYVPKTDERVFEDADADSFKKMPFGADFLRVSKALEELSEINFLEKKPTS